MRFDEISRALVHALKYGDRLDLAPMMGRWIGHAGRELLAGADALVPVPLHWRRLWARRFNQSAMLASAVSAASGVPAAAATMALMGSACETATMVSPGCSATNPRTASVLRTDISAKDSPPGKRNPAGHRWTVGHSLVL